MGLYLIGSGMTRSQIVLLANNRFAAHIAQLWIRRDRHCKKLLSEHKLIALLQHRRQLSVSLSHCLQAVC